MTIMKRKIKGFDLTQIISKGKAPMEYKCSHCNNCFMISVNIKNNYYNKQIVTCNKCGWKFSIGQIYNFNSYRSLGDRLDSRYSHKKFDKQIWE